MDSAMYDSGQEDSNKLTDYWKESGVENRMNFAMLTILFIRNGQDYLLKITRNKRTKVTKFREITQCPKPN
jgi:hypothetical protein